MSKRRYLFFLLPVYGFAVWLRNKFFDLGILKSEVFGVPTISVGNIRVGGTGKTPLTEYIIEKLSKEYNVAVLSRGYKRKSKGFVLSDNRSTALNIGDEPFQIKRKFPAVTVAVDSDRRRGIREILSANPEIDVIVLDDAFQHRYVTPTASILLSDYNNLFDKDTLLPVGRLREPISAKVRADAVVVTKCPTRIKPIDIRIVRKRLDLFQSQKLFFSTQVYSNLIKVFYTDKQAELSINKILHTDGILAVSGISDPKHFDRYLRSFETGFETIHFGDHHFFSNGDIDTISKMFVKLHKNSRRVYIVVTEKDAARFLNMDLPCEIRDNMYALPLKVKFINNDGDAFDQYIRETVSGNGRNSFLTK